MKSKSPKKKTPREIGEEFVNEVIKRIPNSVNIIEEYSSSGNKFDLILTFPKRKNVSKVIKGNLDLAKDVIKKAESIVIIECSKSGEFKAIKENFGEILKIPVLKRDVIKKIKNFYLAHEKIKKSKYRKYFGTLLKLFLKPNFKIELIEFKDIEKIVHELLDTYGAGKKLSKKSKN